MYVCSRSFAHNGSGVITLNNATLYTLQIAEEAQGSEKQDFLIRPPTINDELMIHLCPEIRRCKSTVHLLQSVVCVWSQRLMVASCSNGEMQNVINPVANIHDRSFTVFTFTLNTDSRYR